MVFSSAASSHRLPDKILYALLAAYVLFLSSINVLAIGFSAIHLHLNRFTALLIVAVSLLAACILGRILLRGSLGESWQWAPPRENSAPKFWRYALGLGTGLCLLFYLVMWRISYSSLDITCDGNLYHLPAMSLWAQEGRIHWISPNIESRVLSYINGYAKGAEVVGYIASLAFGDFFANTINCIFLPLGILGIANLARRLGASMLAAAFAGMLFILVPVNIWQSANTYIDSAFASCVIAFFAFFGGYLDSFSSREQPSRSWVPCLTTGMALGLTLGVKGNGAWMVCMVFAGLSAMGLFFVCRRRSSLIASTVADRRRFLFQWFARSGTMLVICLFIGGFWYARDYLRTGNPIYPIELKIAGSRIFPGMDIVDVLEKNTPAEWLDKSMPSRILAAWTQSFDWKNGWVCDTRKGGLGFFWLFGCVPAMALSLVGWLNNLSQSCKPSGRLEADFHKNPAWGPLILAGMAACFFLATQANWWARYTLWIYGIGLPCFAAIITRLMSTSPDAATANVTRNEKFSDRLSFSWLDFLVRLRVPLLPWRKLGVAWVAGSVALIATEGIVSLQEMSQAQQLASKTPNAVSGLCARLFPELANTKIPQIIAEGRGTVMPPFNKSRDGNDGILLLGMLSQPLLAHHWGMVDQRSHRASLDKFQGGEFEYLIWDSRVPLPEEYARFTSLEGSCAGFLDLYRISAPASAKVEGRETLER